MGHPNSQLTARARNIDAPDVRPYPEASDPVLGRIGQTPIIEYESERDARLYCKLEYENPTGSMKDRVALGMISKMLADGTIQSETPVVEASSGNTAGAVALVCARLGLDCHVTFPEGTSGQKAGYMQAYGAETRVCPDVDPDDDDHYSAQAERLAEELEGAFINQYENELNPQVHYEWTGEEVLEQVGSEVTHIVAPMGTGGTLSGIGKRVTEVYPDVEIVGVDGAQSNIWTSFHGEKPVEYDVAVEGLGKGDKCPTMWFDYIDTVETVTDDAAFERARAEARRGLLVGPSTAGALEVADRYGVDSTNTVLTIACDSGSQYFDTITV